MIMSKKLDTASTAARFKKLSEAVEKEQQSIERTDIIPIDAIVFNNDNIFNIDDSEDSIIELAENIKENGLLHNIVVVETEPKKYLLISGERRTRAMKYLGKDKIKATIKKNLSELEILKMLFFANSETREYTTEEKVQIIEGFQAKLQKFETTSEKEAAMKFREYVAQAFNVSERQAYRLIAITSELIAPLKELLFNDIIDINTAATLAQLPESYQQYAIDIIKTKKDSDEMKYAIEQTMDFAKRAKNIISKTNTSLTKHRTSRMYYNSRLEQTQEQLSGLENEILSSGEDQTRSLELTQKKIKLEKTIATITANLEQLNKEIEVESQKQDNEVNKIYSNTMFSIEKGVDNISNDKSGKIAQEKKIVKEVQAIDNAVKHLLDMKPDEELKNIQTALEKYKNKHCK